MRRGWTALPVVALLALAAPSGADSPEITFELTGREDSLTVDSNRPPDLIGQVVDPDPAGFTLRGARIVLSWPNARVHLQWSEEPDYEVTGSWPSYPGPSVPTDVTAAFANCAVDLGLGYPWRPTSTWTLVPWLGLTQVEQQLRMREDYSHFGEVVTTSTDATTNRAWGAGIGLDVTGFPLQSWLALEARLVGRWATGTLHRSSIWESGGSAHEFTNSHRSSVSMWGVEAGVGATVHGVTASLGWSLRDWSVDSGPGRVAGPYARLAARF